MADSDCSNTIFILKPVGADAAASLQSAHNSKRLKWFHFEDGINSITKCENSRRRECTPYFSRPSELELHLQFDPGPKDATQGFIFGTEKERCDVQLLENPDASECYCISRQHFRIDFNWNSGFLRLNNMSPTNGTRISAPSVKNGSQILVYRDMHMLHPAEQTKVHIGSLLFEICFPARGQYQSQYDRNWDVYRRTHQGDLPKMDRVTFESQPEITVFGQHRQGRRNAYYLRNEIGRGDSGMVCQTSDTRTGEVYAAKKFTTRQPG